MREASDIESGLKDVLSKADKPAPAKDPKIKRVDGAVELYDGDDLKVVMPAHQFDALQEELKK